MSNNYEEFMKRCLYKSTNFIENIGMNSTDFNLTPKDQLLLTRFNQRSYLEIKQIICESTCDCCDSRMKFLSIYSEIIHYKTHKRDLYPNLIEKILNLNSNDPYFLFLKAEVDEKAATDYLLDSLKHNNLFYDAFESLLFSSEMTNFTYIENKIERHVTNFLAKRIYMIYFYVIRFKKSTNLEIYVEDLLQYYDQKNIDSFSTFNNEKKENNVNNVILGTIKRSKKNVPTPFIYSLLGAYFYSKKDYKKSKLFFEKNLKHERFCFEFLDLYSHVFYIHNQIPELALLAQKLTKANQYKPETLMAIANYYSAKKDHENAINYLKKSTIIDERYLSNYTLIGHEYFERRIYNMALRCYIFSLKKNRDDYRAYFGIGQVKLHTGALLESEYYFKKAIELQSDNGFFWMSYGTVLEKLNKMEEAQGAYERARDEGEIDGYLKLADLSKKTKKYSESINFYVKYAEECKKINRPCLNVTNILTEYFGKVGDHEKANYFLTMFEK